MAWHETGHMPLHKPMMTNMQGPDSIQRCHLTGIGNPFVKIRRSYDRLISTMGFPIPVRRYLYIESGPWTPSLGLNEPSLYNWVIMVFPAMFESLSPHTVRCCYNAVNYLQISHNSHPIARP